LEYQQHTQHFSLYAIPELQLPSQVPFSQRTGNIFNNKEGIAVWKNRKKN